MFCMVSAAWAQRHDLGSSPPTAPPPKAVVVPQVLTPTAPSLGALQFSTANAAVSAPHILASELQTSDDRIRTSALAAIGAPAQYLEHGHVPFPHAAGLDFVALGTSSELDAILTVELEQHLISAIFIPEDQQWHRIATAIYPTSFSNTSVTPSTFLRAERSLREPQHFTAIFHTTSSGLNGDFTETEVHLGIFNGHAAITTSFTSNERTCDPNHQHPCDIIQRWLQPDAADPEHHFLLVTAMGHERPNQAGDPIAHAETFEESRLRDFSCQPFVFNDISLHFEPNAPAAPCFTPHDPQHDQPLH